MCRLDEEIPFQNLLEKNPYFLLSIDSIYDENKPEITSLSSCDTDLSLGHTGVKHCDNTDKSASCNAVSSYSCSVPCSIVSSYSCLLNNPVSMCLEPDGSEVQISQTNYENIQIYDVPEESPSSGSSLASYMCVIDQGDQNSVKSRDLSEALPNIITGKCLNVAGLQGKLDRGILDVEMSNSDLLVFLEQILMILVSPRLCYKVTI